MRYYRQLLTMMENYGFSVRNYDNYVGTADLNDKEAQLDILAHLDIVPAGEGWTVTEPLSQLLKTESFMAAVLQMTKDRLLQLFMQCVQ